ncbi:MAG TPA: hypothetical protein VJ001_13330 [Rhodocyclaceae bacterium]|nr:hypothetical protein [Rhodocyclaceae bacterium]
MTMKPATLTAGLLACASILTACIGGGGGGGASSPATTTSGGEVSGVASKGLWKGAKVTAYCGNSEAAADKLIETKTDANGEYKLAWTKACLKPVKVVVEADDAGASTMKDEATGKDVAPAAGFKMRALVADPSSNAVKNVTPFTEMAVAIAGDKAELSKTEISNAETAIISTVLGGDIGAFQAKPKSDIANATADEKRLATLLTAVSALAQDDSSCKTKDANGDRIKCAVDKLKQSAANTVTAVSDKGYSVNKSLPTDTPASIMKNTLSRMKGGSISGIAVAIMNEAAGVEALMDSTIDNVKKAAASNDGVVAVASSTGVQAARDLFNSLKNDMLSLSSSDRKGYLDQKIAAMSTDFGSHLQMNGDDLEAFLTAIAHATELAEDVKKLSAPSSTLAANASYPVSGYNDLTLITDATGAPNSYVRTFNNNTPNSSANVNSTGFYNFYSTASAAAIAANLSAAQPSSRQMNCRVKVSEMTLGKAGCYYGYGKKHDVNQTASTWTSYFHSVKVAATDSSGGYAWDDMLSSREYSFTPLASPAGNVAFTGFAPNKDAVDGGKQSGTFSRSRDANNVITSLTIKGNILPLVSGADNSNLDIGATLTQNSTVKTLDFNGAVANLKANAVIGAMALSKGSQLVINNPGNGETIPVSMTLKMQAKTAAFQYDGTIASGNAVKTPTGDYAPAAPSFTGTISTLTNGVAGEFLSGTISATSSNLASYNPKLATSAGNFLAAKLDFSGKATNGSGTSYAISFSADRTAYDKIVTRMSYSRAGAALIGITGSSTLNSASNRYITTVDVIASSDITLKIVDGVGTVYSGTTKIGDIVKNKVTFSDGAYMVL